MSLPYSSEALDTAKQAWPSNLQTTIQHGSESAQQQQRRRSLDDMRPLTSTREQDRKDHRHISETKRRAFQRRRLHLQDPAAWGETTKAEMATRDLQDITNALGGMKLFNHISRKVAMMPPSSTRLDWFYKTEERIAKRKALKIRLRGAQAGPMMQSDGMVGVLGSSEESGHKDNGSAKQEEWLEDSTISVTWRRHSG